MRIGLLSDTHGYMDEQMLSILAGCDRIVHAGDIGRGVLAPLRRLAPVIAVRGNVDESQEGAELPDLARFTEEGLRIAVVHNVIDAPPRDEWDVLMFGHCHRQHADEESGKLLLNPGAAGRRGFHHRRSMLLADLVAGQPIRWQFSDLGPRAAARRPVPVGAR